jgi:hypothetical protein
VKLLPLVLGTLAEAVSLTAPIPQAIEDTALAEPVLLAAHWRLAVAVTGEITKVDEECYSFERLIYITGDALWLGANIARACGNFLRHAG